MFTYGQDILKHVLGELGEPQDVTGSYVSDYLTLAKEHINTFY